MRYGMVIDLQKCTGCNSCTVACRAEKGTPAGVHFHKVMKYETGKYPNAKMKFLPMPCMHCQDPPCLKVCPTAATYIHPDGLVLVDEKIWVNPSFSKKKDNNWGSLIALVNRNYLRLFLFTREQ